MALGCLVKGRSSSDALNKELEQSLPNMIGYDTYLECMYFETTRHKADGLSRGDKVPGPSRRESVWWGPLSEGKFELFDAW